MTASHVELLEARVLLAATVASPLANVSVSPNSAPTSIDVGGDFSDPQVAGTAVLIKTTNGNIPLDLLDSVAPITVANFLRYVNGGLYDGTIFHRTVSDFIDQAGGFKTDGSAIPTFGTIQNEFHVSNTAGTVAMAKLSGDPNSATSQWFINVADNSAVLDPQNGGFTVFAQVLYNGLTVADQINSLPTIDGSLLTSALPGKPDNPLPVQNAAAGAVAANLVVIDSAAVVPPLFFSASSDDPSLVAAAIGPDGHTLSLSYAPNSKGVAHITVTATDLGGGTVSQTFRVNVGTSGDFLNVATGKGAAKSVSVRQADGTMVMVSLKGPGTATVQALGDDLQQTKARNGNVVISGSNASLFNIIVSGTTSASTLSLTTKGGTTGEIGGITTSSALGAISGKTVALGGNLTAGGPIKTILLHATDATNTVGGTSQITASSIGTLIVQGNLSNAGISLGGTGSALRTLTILGAMDGVELQAAGNIGNVTVGSMSSSMIFAGVAPLPSGQPLPESASQFAASDTMSQLRVRGVFSQSIIAAQTLGKLSLGQISTSGAGTFGLAAVHLTAVSGAASGKRISLRKPHDQAAVSAAVSQLGVTDFTVELL